MGGVAFAEVPFPVGPRQCAQFSADANGHIVEKMTTKYAADFRIKTLPIGTDKPDSIQ